MRTVPVAMMPSLYQVEKNRFRILLLLLPLLLSSIFTIVSGIMIPFAVPESTNPVAIVQTWTSQLDSIGRFVAVKLLSFDDIYADIWQGFVITGLVILVGSFIGFWSGMYDSSSANQHCYVMQLRPKSGVIIRQQ